MAQESFLDIYGFNSRQPQLPSVPSVVENVTDPNTGQIVQDLKYKPTQEAPSSFGVLKCACYLWPQCPFYAIKHQEYTLSLSPQTVSNLPSEIKDKLSFMTNGDGVFMRISNSSISTYLSHLRDTAENQAPTQQSSTYGMMSTKQLDFLPTWDRYHQVLGYSPFSTVANSTNASASADVGQVSSSSLSFVAANQMWVEIGSIYQEKTRNPRDYGSPILLLQGPPGSRTLSKSRLQMFMAPKWQYKTMVGAPDAVVRKLGLFEAASSKAPYNGATPQPTAKAIFPGDILYDDLTADSNVAEEEKEYFYKMPSISGLDSLSDPLDLILSLQNGQQMVEQVLDADLRNNTSKFYSVADLNPGLHWGLMKNIPLRTNQGFTLHFASLSPESFKIANTNHRYQMLKKFAWLDPLQQNLINNCIEDIIENPEQMQDIQEKHRVAFDFSAQEYILIAFPPDLDSALNKSKKRNLYLLICESMPPTLMRDSGYATVCRKEFTIDDGTGLQDGEIIWAGSENPSDQPGENTTTTQQNGDVPAIQKRLEFKNGFFEIARCDFLNSTALFAARDLKIHFRVDLGKLVIQFVIDGQESAHWVTTNSIEEPENLSATLLFDKNNNTNLKRKNIPFNFTEDVLRVYGGNKKLAFGYSPLKFDPEVTVPFPPQNFQSAPNIELTPDCIHILLSDSTYPYLPAKFLTNFAAKYSDYASIKDPYEKDRKKCQGRIENKYDEDKKTINRETVVTTLTRPENLMSSNNTELRIIKDVGFSNQPGATDVNKFLVFNLQMKSGSLYLPDPDTGGYRQWPYAETPSLRTIRLLLPADQPAWQERNIDLSKYVLSFADEWSETDFQKVSHTGNISFLIPQARSDDDGVSARIRSTLLGLVDKNFYLRICLWWDRYDQVGANAAYKSTLSPKENENFPDTESIGSGQLDYNVMFTGFCTGGNVTVENNKQVLSCSILDYSQVLKDSLFFNSPYFDRMTDTFAVREILNMIKFRFCKNAPAYLVDKSCTDKNVKSNISVDALTNIRVTKYVLPGSYNMIEAPAHKFADNTPMWDAIEKFALQSSKITYFDALGRFRYIDMPFDSLLFEQRTSNKSTKAAAYADIVNEAKKYGIYCASFKDMKNEDQPPDTPRHLLIEEYKFERIVADTKNRILIISTSPNGELFIAGDINYDSFYNPDKEGFIGYEKIFVQMDGIFGSEATVKQMVAHYTKMYIPPLKVSFKARGYRCMTCMTPILFMGLGAKEPQPLIVSKVANEIDVAGNRWTQNFDTIWLFEGRGVDFGETREMEVDFKGVVDAPKNITPPKQK